MTLFRPGVHVIVWPNRGWHHLDPAALAADLVDLGAVGCIPQCSDEAPGWIHSHGAALAAAGLDLVAGLGRVTAPAILAALAEPLCRGALLDEEDWHRVDDAAALTRAVLAAFPDDATRAAAVARIGDCMYPYVVATPSGHCTGHRDITKAFNALCGAERAPQCYVESAAIRDGAVARILRDARGPSEWPAIGVSADRIIPTVQAYHRSVGDHVALTLAEPVVILWDYCEMDASCRVALRVVRALQGRGFAGPGAVGAFQAMTRLPVDGVVGPATCAALGVDAPAGVVWTQP